MRIFLGTLLITFLSLTSLFAQSKKIDSLKILINQPGLQDTSLVALNSNLAKSYISIDIDSAEKYIRKAQNISLGNDQTNYTGFIYLISAEIHRAKGELNEALGDYSNSITINSKRTKRNVGEYYNSIGLIYLELGDFAKAEKYLKQSIRSFYELEDQQKISSLYISLGSVYGSQDNTILATEYFLKALNLKIQQGDSLGISGCYTNLSNIYHRIGEFPKSLEYALKAKEIRLRNSPTSKQLIGVYNNVGTAYESLGNHRVAMANFRHGVDLAFKQNSSEDLVQLYCNIGQCFISQNLIDSAVFYLNRSLEIAKEIEFEEGKMYATNYLADIYYPQKKYAQALDYAKESYNIALKNGIISMIEENANVFFNIYNSQHDWKSAVHWLEIHHLYVDSLKKIEDHKEIAKLNYVNQLQDRDNQIKLLYKENLVQNQENKMQRLYIYIFVCLAILILTFSYVYYEQVKKLSLLNKQLESQNIEIATQSEKLAQINLIKDRVISVMSHDMRGPISSLYSIIELYNSKQISQEELESLFPQLSKSVNSVSILLDNILGWVKSQMAEGDELNLAEVNPHQIVDEIEKVYHHTALQKHIIIANLIPQHLNIISDKNNLSLILRNLVNNAIKFSHHGQKVELMAEKKEDIIKITVKDYGVGMNNDEMQKLFNLDKLHTSLGTNEEKGTGLGLLLVKVSVEKLQGSLTINSKKEMGTEFIIKLPIHYS